MFFKKYLLLSILCVFITVTGFAQVVINANPKEGCGQLTVSFTSPPTTSTIAWDFGNGKSSGDQNPTTSYSPGTYTVKYSSGLGSNTITIKVYNNPVADFKATGAARGCVGLPVNFIDLSTAGGGASIAKAEWAYGDGAVGLGTASSHTYTLAGAFNVSLKVTDVNGCVGSVTKTDYVKVSKPPVAIISTTPNPLSACTPPLNATMSASGSTSNSTTGPGLTYLWSFGNGLPDDSKVNTSTVYSTKGTFTLKLTVYDDNLCSNTITQTVTVDKPKASFVAKNSVGGYTCRFVQFTNKSSAGIYSYDYGDGSPLSNVPQHNYSSVGPFKVKLTVTVGTCSDDTTINITVEDVKAKFASTPHFGCNYPFNIQFTDQSTNATRWRWFFGNGDTSNLQNPLLSIKKTPQDQDTNAYKIIQRKTFYTTLLAYSAHGCQASFNLPKPDTLFPPTAAFYAKTTTLGCAPLSVQFKDTTRSDHKVSNYEWIFGDGSPNVSGPGDSLVSHTFTNPGKYKVSLVINTTNGCIDTSYYIIVKVGKALSPSFTFSPPGPICRDASVTLTSPTVADAWHYTSDNRKVSGCYSSPTTTWAFGDTTGTQDITLSVMNNGCVSSVTQSNAITVKGPIARFTYTANCSAPLVYNINGSAIMDATSWDWDYGDGTPKDLGSTNKTPVHVYAASGTYKIFLKAYNTNGCTPDTMSRTIIVKKPVAAFISPNPVVCKGDTIKFDAGTSSEVFSNGFYNRGYAWKWGDNTPDVRQSDPVARHPFKPGKYKVLLTVTAENGCTDTISKQVAVGDIKAGFDTINSNVCVPIKLNFKQSSTSDNTITSYSWDFGDGAGTSTLAVPPVYTYPDPSGPSYTVKLLIKDNLNCKDSVTFTVAPSIPNPTFSAASNNKICLGAPINFTATGTKLTYKWDFGDSNGSTSQNPTHLYTVAGNYQVVLTVVDTNGCKAVIKSLSLADSVKVQAYPKPIVFSTLDAINNRCYPKILQFTDTTGISLSDFGIRKWDLGNNKPTLGLKTVGDKYGKGSFTIKLTETTSNGCTDSTSYSFTLVGPEATLTAGPTTTICKGDSITFSINSIADVAGFIWDFGDGTLDSISQKSPITHRYNFHPPNGKTVATLIYYGNNKTCKQPINDTIHINEVIADFKRNNELLPRDSVHCLHLVDKIGDISQNADVKHWDFGNGTTHDGNNPPAQTYTKPGVYKIKLNISSSVYGCVDTIIKTIRINPDPTLTALSGDACEGDTTTLSAWGNGISYLWTPGTDLNSDIAPKPIANPHKTTKYKVVTTDNNGCTKDTTVTALIYPKPPHGSLDTSVIIGTNVKLGLTNYGGFRFKWTPANGLSCSTCGIPTTQVFYDTTYTLIITDTANCFTDTSKYKLRVKPITTIDVPTGFTPNGDGHNDVIKVDGYGIKQLLEFKIFNRWGEIVFSSDDITQGWDGYFNGKLQDIDTYIYTATVLTYINDNKLSKKGSFELLK